MKRYAKRVIRKFRIIMAISLWLKPKQSEGLSAHQTIHTVPVKRLLTLATVPTFLTSSMTLIVIKMTNTFAFFYKTWWSVNLFHKVLLKAIVVNSNKPTFFRFISSRLILILSWGLLCIFCQNFCRCFCSTREFCSVVPQPFDQHPKFNASHCFSMCLNQETHRYISYRRVVFFICNLIMGHA